MLTEFSKDRIWTKDYAVRLPVCPINARMSVVRVGNGEVMLHSPCDIDDATAADIAKLGNVAYIVAPGSLHHLHVAGAQRRYPDAQTYICPGVERRAPGLRYDGILDSRPPAAWPDTIDQILIPGRYVQEIAMLHKPGKTLLLVDSIENYSDHTGDVSWQLKFWWKLLRMWNKPKPAPEYRFGWKDKAAARTCFETILQWDFDRIILSHGNNIVQDAKAIARRAWTPPLEE